MKKGAKKAPKEEQKAPAKGKGAKKENERPRSKSANKSAEKKRGKSKQPKSPPKGKSPVKSKSPAKKSPAKGGKKKQEESKILSKLSAEVADLKQEKKKPASKEESKTTSVPGHDYKTQPKRPAGAYILYNTATVAKLKEEEGLDHKAAFARSGQLWATMDEAARAPWEKENLKDVERFERERKELETKGYFITKDGVKSTDLPVDAKKKWGKDVVMPKNAKSAYNVYSAQNLAKVKEKHNCK
jgi:hypothetical protein